MYKYGQWQIVMFLVLYPESSHVLGFIKAHSVKKVSYFELVLSDPVDCFSSEIWQQWAQTGLSPDHTDSNSI